jgi:PIN domain
MPRYTAVLDACVLVPIALADTLFRVAEKGLYRPLWTDRILSEAQAAIEEIHPGIDVSKRFAGMREAFNDALVTGWEELEGGLSLPDENDRHVVAAASRAARKPSSP